MTARLDQFVDVLLREKAEQLYLLPDEPVTIVTGGRPRKVTRQPLTDRHIYALLVDVMYRSLARNEAAWDLMALVIGGGLFCGVYQARQKILGHGWVMKVVLVACLAGVALVRSLSAP